MMRFASLGVVLFLSLVCGGCEPSTKTWCATYTNVLTFSFNTHVRTWDKAGQKDATSAFNAIKTRVENSLIFTQLILANNNVPSANKDQVFDLLQKTAAGLRKKQAPTQMSDYCMVVEKSVDTLNSLPYKDREITYRDGYITGIRAFLNQLDPYSSFLTSKEAALYLKSAKLASEGANTGVRFAWNKTNLYIVSVPPESSAFGDLGKGDRIIGIDRMAISKHPKLVENLFDPSESTKGFTLTITRDEKSHKEVYLPVLRALGDGMFKYETKDGLSVIGWRSFKADTGSKFEKTLKDVVAARPRGIILDLRDNTGGDTSALPASLGSLIGDRRLLSVQVNPSVQLAEIFKLVGGASLSSLFDLLVARKDDGYPRHAGLSQHSADWRHSYELSKVDHDAYVTRIPLAVLVNENTASCGDEFTSVLQDWGKAVVMGRKTYGKGIGQNVFRLKAINQIQQSGQFSWLPQLAGEAGDMGDESEAVVNVTTFQFLRPSLISAQGTGVTPDIEFNRTLPFAVQRMADVPNSIKASEVAIPKLSVEKVDIQALRNKTADWKKLNLAFVNKQTTVTNDAEEMQAAQNLMLEMIDDGVFDSASALIERETEAAGRL